MDKKKRNPGAVIVHYLRDKGMDKECFDMECLMRQLLYARVALVERYGTADLGKIKKLREG